MAPGVARLPQACTGVGPVDTAIPVVILVPVAILLLVGLVLLVATGFWLGRGR
jgi:hypothetical protein